MEVRPVPDSTPSFRERTVSDLALLFESKIKERVESSPYLRHYRKFAPRNLENGSLSINELVENETNGSSPGESSPLSLKSSVAATTSRIGHELPSATSVNNNAESGSCSDNEKHVGPFKDAESGLDTSMHKLRSSSSADNNRIAARPSDSPSAFFYEGSPTLPHFVKTAQHAAELRSPQSSKEERILECDSKPTMEPRKATLGMKQLKKANRKAVESKPKRTGSFASGLQRLMRLDKRRGSLDEREIGRLKFVGLNSLDSEPGSKTTDLSFLRKAEGKQTDSENSTPKLSFAAARKHSDVGVADGESTMSGKKTKKRRLKGFFRAISLNNVRDVKRSEQFLDSSSCCECGERQTGSTMHLSLESFNAIKDERDHLKRERDRAVDEWTEAASKWEIILDDMDALLVELAQVKKERDEKAAEIPEIIDRYEEDIKAHEDNFEQIRADFVEMEAQLTVAKKERVHALTEYEDLLKRHYDVQQELDVFEDDNSKLRGCIKASEQSIASLEQQVENLQQERDQALQLWNSSVKERKKLHQEMESLIQSRDSSLRKAFQQAEELNKMREDRDALRRELNSNNTNRTLESKERPRSVHGNRFNGWNGSSPDSGHEVSRGYSNSHDASQDEHEAEFNEFAVSLDRLDSKYGIKVDTAVDEPNVMIVHVGAHVSSRNDIRVYDRILSVNGVSVYRADKKTVDKLLKDCPGRLTMVLRRQNYSGLLEEMIKNVDITLPKSGNQNSKRLHQGLGMKCKIQIVSIDSSSSVSGVEDVDPGDVIMNINTQDVNKVLEAVFYKLAKKSNGSISLRLKKALSSRSEKANQSQLLSPRSTTKTQSLSDVSESSNHSIASFTSEETAATAYTDDSESLFSGSLAPSTLYPFNEDGNDDDITSLPERLRKLSNPFPETERTMDNQFPNGLHQHRSSKNGHLLTNENPSNTEHGPTRRSSENRSFRSLKNAYSSRGPKQPLRRARSDAVDRKAAEKPFATTEQEKVSSTPSISAKSLPETSEEPERSSWVMPSPELPRKQGLNENNAINIFATLPRQRKKIANEVDCNKQTSHRVLRLEKISHEPLGFDICGGNKVGIFIKEIQEGSMAALGGMKVGDRLLYMNSFDLSGATLDFATRIVLRSERLTSFRIEVKYEEKFKDIMKEVPRDSLYVRALRSYDSCGESELNFVSGEILHITNTMAYQDKSSKTSWKWYGEKVSRKASGEAGLVPRLESFIQQDERERVPDPEADPERTPTNQKKKKRPFAADVKNWLLRKPSINKNKKYKENRLSGVEHEDKNRYYEILMDK